MNADPFQTPLLKNVSTVLTIRVTPAETRSAHNHRENTIK